MEIKIAKTFCDRLIGLSFKKNINYGMIFNKCNKIHTFMMKFNLDIYILDNNNMIVEVKKDVTKNKIVIINLPRKKTSVLEIPSNTGFNHQIGDVLFTDNI